MVAVVDSNSVYTISLYLDTTASVLILPLKMVAATVASSEMSMESTVIFLKYRCAQTRTTVTNVTEILQREIMQRAQPVRVGEGG